MSAVIAYLDFEDLPIEKLIERWPEKTAIEGDHHYLLTLDDCLLEICDSGRLFCRNKGSIENAIKGLRLFRMRCEALLGRPPTIISYAVVEKHRAKLPIKRLSDYKKVYSIEAKEIFYAAFRARESLRTADISSLIDALADNATVRLVHSKCIDEEKRRVKYVLIDLDAKKTALASLNLTLRSIGAGIEKETTAVNDMLVKGVRPAGTEAIRKNIILSVLANAVFEYVVKPLVELMTFHFSPVSSGTRDCELSDLAQALPEVRHLTSVKRTTLSEIATALGKQEWDVLACMNRLVQKGVVIECDDSHQTIYSLSPHNNSEVVPLARSIPSFAEEEAAMADFVGFLHLPKS